jgi:hypothetical protein
MTQNGHVQAALPLCRQGIPQTSADDAVEQLIRIIEAVFQFDFQVMFPAFGAWVAA